MAKVVEDVTTKTAIALGTPSYAAPEMSHAERISFKSDVFSLGIILWESLTLDVPFANTVGTTKPKPKGIRPDWLAFEGDEPWRESLSRLKPASLRGGQRRRWPCVF